MAMESKYTSPRPVTVAQVLARNPAAMPIATGVSIPGRRRASSRHAPLKNGPQENSITGTVRTRLAQRIRLASPPDRSPAPSST